MASLNHVVIMGNLGRDPEVRTTGSGTAVCTLNIATTEYSKGEDGQKKETTEWHRVVVWAKQAESCAKFLKKGRTVLVEGRIVTRTWDDIDGNKRFSTEIVAQNVQFIGGQGLDRAASTVEPPQLTTTSDEIPF